MFNEYICAISKVIFISTLCNLTCICFFINLTGPPDKPKNFSCETNDLQRLHCTWTPGPIHNFYRHLAEKYVLHEW